MSSLPARAFGISALSRRSFGDLFPSPFALLKRQAPRDPLADPPLPLPHSARKSVKETAKRKRAEQVTARADEKAKTRGTKKKTQNESSDDEVEDLDQDVIAAVARRDKEAVEPKQTPASRKEKLSKKALKRAAIRAAREAEEGYLGDGVWEKDGVDVRVVNGQIDDGRICGTDTALAFLQRRNSGHKRSGKMLLDPKTGKARQVGGVNSLGVGKKR